jgi:hypothetical protein
LGNKGAGKALPSLSFVFAQLTGPLIVQVFEKLTEYKVEGLVNLNLMEDKEAGKANRGFAFLEMASHAVAAKALRLLTKGEVKFGAHLQAKVRFCLAGRLCKTCVSAHLRGRVFVGVCAICHWTGTTS